MTDKLTNALRKIAAQPGFNNLMGSFGSPAMRVAFPAVAQWEGTKLNSRNRHSVYKDIKGIETIGYGSTDPKLIETYRDAGMPERTAQRVLFNRLTDTEKIFAKERNWPKLKPHQQAALLSWGYNVGNNAVRNSTLLKYLRSGQLELIPTELGKWKYARRYDKGFDRLTPNAKQDSSGRWYVPEVVKGLENRRNNEIAMYNGKYHQ